MRKRFTALRVFALTCFALMIFFTMVISFNSCKKVANEREEEKKEQNVKTETALKKKPSPAKIIGPCPYECDDPRCLNYSEPSPDCGGGGTVPKPMTAIFQSVNHTQLLQLLNANDSIGVEDFFYSIALQVANQIKLKYGEDIRNEIGAFPQAMILLGLFEYGKENNISLDDSTALKAIDPYTCFRAALSEVFGVTAIRDLYLDFKTGASPRTIVRALKTLGKRTLFSITIGWAIWDLGDCLEWW